MGSTVRHEEVLQKLRDILGASPISASFMETLSQNDPDQDPYRTLLCYLLRMGTVAEVEVLVEIMMHVREMGIALDRRNLKKYLVSKLRMDGHEASFCRTSWISTFGRTKGGPEGPSEVVQFTRHHEFFDVMVKDGDGENPTRLIVDMDFRSEFELAKATPTYKELTKFIPMVFVGTEKKLKWIISLLCKAMQKSLKESGLYIPPWRKTSYMQSKWFSKDCNKDSVFTDMNLAHMGMSV
ncbi:hypothetical protein CJ030_MR3G025365 [Morella rubra]|uniref:Uncharacterized protein n=1 Tax=Morella rubra TaxID=262757 RepID=A0A6A1W6P5_9ROSI|nr:hypothetical protein CJ030_MR3G025365 [Morella rubra]